MICFAVSLNGTPLCTAGVGPYGVLTTIVSWAVAAPEDRPPDYDEALHDQVHLHVGGIQGRSHVRFGENLDTLRPGDEIVVRVIEAASADEPTVTREDLMSADRKQQQRRALYERLRVEFSGQGEVAG
jgi:hypothetical protein